MATLVTGAGAPVTVAPHGMGASLAETRPLLGGVPGTRVLYDARGHADAPAPERPGWAELAADLAAVLDAHGATQALGVSMGSATLLRLLAADPDRLRRVVLFLPAAVDRPRDDDGVRRLADLAGALRARDAAAVQALVRAELPADLGPSADAYVAARTAHLLASPGLPPLLDALPTDVPVEEPAALGKVTAEVLVLAQQGDPLHTVAVAEQVAGLLPRAELVVFDAPGVLWRERARLRALVSAHLSAP
ncbi:MAG: alpha/beta fold hydrolase [Myxococcaceae bacterium]